MANLFLWMLVVWGTTMIVSEGKIFAGLRDRLPKARARWFLIVVEDHPDPLATLEPIDAPKNVTKVATPSNLVPQIPEWGLPKEPAPEFYRVEDEPRDPERYYEERYFLKDRAAAELTWRNFLGTLLACPMCTGFWVGVVWAMLGLSPVHLEVAAVPQKYLLFPSLLGAGAAASGVSWTWHVVLHKLGADDL